jgi:ketosteroid isomerase-like protein
MLAGVGSFRHDVVEQLVGDDSVGLRAEVTYTLAAGGEVRLPALTVMRFRDGRVCEYLIYEDPTPLVREAGR